MQDSHPAYRAVKTSRLLLVARELMAGISAYNLREAAACRHQ